MAELGAQERQDELPSDLEPDGPAAETHHVHVVVLDTLRSRKVVVDQCRVSSGNLVGADGRSDAAAAHRDAALERSCRDCLREWNDEVRVVVVRVQRTGPEIDDVMPGGAKACEDSVFQGESTVISRDAQVHAGSPRCVNSVKTEAATAPPPRDRRAPRTGRD